MWTTTFFSINQEIVIYIYIQKQDANAATTQIPQMIYLNENIEANTDQKSGKRSSGSQNTTGLKTC